MLVIFLHEKKRQGKNNFFHFSKKENQLNLKHSTKMDRICQNDYPMNSRADTVILLDRKRCRKEVENISMSSRHWLRTFYMAY